MSEQKNEQKKRTRLEFKTSCVPFIASEAKRIEMCEIKHSHYLRRIIISFLSLDIGMAIMLYYARVGVHLIDILAITACSFGIGFLPYKSLEPVACGFTMALSAFVAVILGNQFAFSPAIALVGAFAGGGFWLAAFILKQERHAAMSHVPLVNEPPLLIGPGVDCKANRRRFFVTAAMYVLLGPLIGAVAGGIYFFDDCIPMQNRSLDLQPFLAIGVVAGTLVAIPTWVAGYFAR
jgi:hypothetical protein